jgi:hypothetical protein
MSTRSRRGFTRLLAVGATAVLAVAGSVVLGAPAQADPIGYTVSVQGFSSNTAGPRTAYTGLTVQFVEKANQNNVLLTFTEPDVGGVYFGDFDPIGAPAFGLRITMPTCNGAGTVYYYDGSASSTPNRTVGISESTASWISIASNAAIIGLRAPSRKPCKPLQPAQVSLVGTVETVQLSRGVSNGGNTPKNLAQVKVPGTIRFQQLVDGDNAEYNYDSLATGDGPVVFDRTNLCYTHSNTLCTGSTPVAGIFYVRALQYNPVLGVPPLFGKTTAYSDWSASGSFTRS